MKPITLTSKSTPEFFDNMKFLLMNQKPVIQVSEEYMDVTCGGGERCHRILNPKSASLAPGTYITEKNQKQKIVFRQAAWGDVYQTPCKLDKLPQKINSCIPSFGLPRAKPLPREFEQIPYGGNYRNKFDSQYLSFCFGQVVVGQALPHFLIDVDFLRQVIEVPAPQPGWFFRSICSKPSPIFCFVVQHEFDFRLALVASLTNFDNINRLQERRTKYLYPYEELTISAKKRAREEFRVHNLEDWDWYADVTDDVKRVAALMGIEIDKIYFRGFCSQGDGAYFTGDYKYMEGGFEKVKQYAPEDRVLHEIVEELEKTQREHFFQLTAKITQHGMYCHSNSVQIKITPPSSISVHVAQILRRFMDWIYRQLEKEYEYKYHQLDGSIAETLISNAYEFNEDGILI